MTTKHTPGPWVAADDGWIDGIVEYAGCGSHEAEWSNPADKALVLAAPALLEALSGLLDAYLKPDDRICCTGLHCGCMGATHRDLAEHIAREAIALATLDTNEQSGL